MTIKGWAHNQTEHPRRSSRQTKSFQNHLTSFSGRYNVNSFWERRGLGDSGILEALPKNAS